MNLLFPQCSHHLARQRLRKERQQFRKERRETIKNQILAAEGSAELLNDDSAESEYDVNGSDNDKRSQNIDSDTNSSITGPFNNETKFEDAVSEVTVTTEVLNPYSESNNEDDQKHDNTCSQPPTNASINDTNAVKTTKLKYKNDRSLPKSKLHIFASTTTEPVASTTTMNVPITSAKNFFWFKDILSFNTKDSFVLPMPVISVFLILFHL